MMTVLHAVQWPLACLCGVLAGLIARRRKLSGVEAYALALVPGVLIYIASEVFGPARTPRDQQPWLGLLIWAAWSAFGVIAGSSHVRKRRITTLNLSGNDR
ncbi:MAG: hypothetical protein ABSH46_03925 [Bryobacteraceae bacterium]|jgi:zinc transporter ZupT